MIILTFAAPSLFAPLRAGPFARADVEVVTVPSVEALRAQARARRPDVVIVPAAAPRAARLLAELRMTAADGALLLLAAELGQPAPEDTGLFDGVVVLEQAEQDLQRLLLPWLGRPERRHRRTSVSMPALLYGPGMSPVEARTVDLSEHGAGLVLPCAPPDKPVEVALQREDGRRVTVRAVPCWSRREGQAARAGLRLVDVGEDTAAALADLAFWHVRVEDGQRVVHLAGSVSGATRVPPRLTSEIALAGVIDLGALGGIADSGIALWLELFARLPGSDPVWLRRVPIGVARLFLRLPAMTFRCVVQSALVAYRCGDCGLEVEELVELGRSTHRRCPLCETGMLPGVTLFALGEPAARTPTRPFRPSC